MDQQKSLKGLVFDFDGTLFDLDIDWAKLKNKLGINESDSLQTFLDQQTSIRAKQETYAVIEQAEIEAVHKATLNPSTARMLDELSEKYKIIIFSRNSKQAIKQAFSSCPKVLEKMTIIGREVYDDLKPDVKALRVALSNIDINPSSVLVIGDTYHDLEVAKALSVQCIIVSNPKNKYIPGGATYYIDKINEVTNILEADNDKNN